MSFFCIAVTLLVQCSPGEPVESSLETILGQGIFEIVRTDTGKVQTAHRFTVPERMEALKVSGLSIALIEDFDRIETIAYGQRDSLRPASPQTVFQMASVSKYVTALLVHQLVHDGVLDLDKDINDYLTSWKMPESEFTRRRAVTLRQLLSHRSGIPSMNLEYVRQTEPPTLVQILDGEHPALNAPAHPKSLPGETWAYSNLGYAVIQQLLEDVTGKPFPALARDVLFKPLGMERSSFEYPLPAALASHEAQPFDSAGQQQKADIASPSKAQGGLLSTPGDMALLTREVLKAYKGMESYFDQSVAAHLFSGTTLLPFEMYGQPAAMGLGVLLLGEGKSFCFLHNGYNTPGSVAIVMAFPETGDGIVVASNSANGEQLYLEVIATVAEARNWPNGQFFLP